MSKRKFAIGPFLGPVTSLDPSMIGPNNSSDELNVKHEDGRLQHRDGYDFVTAKITDFQDFGMLQYVSGYDGSYVNQKEVLYSYTLNGTPDTYPVIRRDATSAMGNSATLGTAAIALDSAVAFDGTAYLYNATTPTAGYLYTHLVGTNGSLASVTLPTKPSTSLVLSKVVSYGGTDYTTYPNYNGTGLDPTSASEIAVTGTATNTGSSLVNSSLIAIAHTANGSAGTQTVIMDLTGATAGKPDWYYNDCFAFHVYCKTSTTGSAYVKVDFSTLVVELYDENNALLPCDEIIQKNPSRTDSWVICRYKNKTRSNWGNGSGTGKVRYIKYTYKTSAGNSGTAANNIVYFETPLIGGSWLLPAGTDTKSEETWSFGYTYRINYSGNESEIAGNIDVAKKRLFSIYADDGTTESTVPYANLGCHLKLTHPASGESAVDKVRTYWKDYNSQTWQYITEVNDSTGYSYVRSNYNELIAGTDWTRKIFDLAKPITCATGFKGWVVWGYKDGYQNIKHSRVGEPLAQESDTDLEDDLNRGATFTLADNMHDAPIAMHQAGDALVILGTYGVYVQWGDRPSNMTPPVKIQAESGIINPFASCMWSDDKGAPTVMYMDRHRTGIYGVQLVPYQSGKVVEITSGVRNKFDWLTSSGTYASSVRLISNPEDNSLWVVCRTKAMVLRRPNLLDRKRAWEFYEYNMPTATDSSKEPYLAMLTCIPDVPMMIASVQEEGGDTGGRIVKLESSYVPGSGPTTYAFCDGGEVPPQAYWTSKTFDGPNRRINHVELSKEDEENETTIRCVSTRATNDITIMPGQRTGRFGFDQQGWKHTFTIYVDPDDAYVESMVVEEFLPQGARPLR